jgi:ubiquinone/menaquinone biosynthesis C-methylase UbiE
MNRLGRAVLNSSPRAWAQRRYVVPSLGSLGGDLSGCRVLEIGCGRGLGAQLLVEVLDAASVEAIDVDPAMVRLASRRIDSRVEVRVGDMAHTRVASDSYDAVVDMGAMHLEREWRRTLCEVRRVLKPEGRFYFEEIVQPARQALSTLAAGRVLPRDLTRASLLADLDTLGFTLVGLESTGSLALTGVVGDLLGVATLRS